MTRVTVVGGGLAGCEAAWQLACRGHDVSLVEMKPAATSPAHRTPLLAELVCSNSLKSDAPETPHGLLKAELRRLGSLILACADAHRVPAGDALAVDRVAFAREVTIRLALHPRVRIERRAMASLPDGLAIVATGPLTGGELARELGAAGGAGLYFYDAIAPIVSFDSLDPSVVFRQSRRRRPPRKGKGAGPAAQASEPAAQASEPAAQASEPGSGEEPEGDYLNCPLDRAAYERLVAELRASRQVAARAFEEPRYFEGCLPVEVIAERGEDALAFGPMRPIGLTDPRTGRRPHAVLQLRPENRYGTAYNLVGFQTRLAWPEQRRIFRSIPGLEQAEFLRYGSIHRNSYLDAPRLLGKTFELLRRPSVRFAGQITGVEGYLESTASGLLAALFLAADLAGAGLPPPPETTALGALWGHVTCTVGTYTPTNVHFGLLPPPPAERMKKQDRRAWLVARARADLEAWWEGPATEAVRTLDLGPQGA